VEEPAVSRMSDDEVTRRIVDRVERDIRRDGLTGAEGGTEARRRFDASCPWSRLAEKGPDGRWRPADSRWPAYQREVERAMTRLFSPGAGAVEVQAEGAATLAILPELEAWARARRVAVRTREARVAAADPDGPETLDMFADGAA